MYKQYDLSGIWRFAMDPDKNGVREQFFATVLPDTIPLPGTTAQAKRVPIIHRGIPATSPSAIPSPAGHGTRPPSPLPRRICISPCC